MHFFKDYGAVLLINSLLLLLIAENKRYNSTKYDTCVWVTITAQHHRKLHSNKTVAYYYTYFVHVTRNNVLMKLCSYICILHKGLRRSTTILIISNYCYHYINEYQE